MNAGNDGAGGRFTRIAVAMLCAAALQLLLTPAVTAQGSGRDSAKVMPADDINTGDNELSPMWDEDSGEPNGTFYFTRGVPWYLDTTAHFMYQTSIQSSKGEQQNGFWKLAPGAARLNLDGLPADGYESGAATIPGCAGTQRMYVAAADLSELSSGSANRSDIHLYVRENGAFVRKDGADELRFINSAGAWDSHPTALMNNAIFFASDRPGGKGGLDIWYVLYDGAQWQGPFNASDINTEFNEAFPFLPASNARTIYFSSDRPREGASFGFDIYAARRDYAADKGPYLRAPLRYAQPDLMPKVNTRYNEICYVAVDNARGFFASDAPREKWGGTRNFDIYQVIPNPYWRDTVDRQEIIAVDRCDPAHPPVNMEFTLVERDDDGAETTVAQGRVNDETGRATITFLNSYRENSGTFILKPNAGDRYFNVPVRIRPARRVLLDTIPLMPFEYRNNCDFVTKDLVFFETASSRMTGQDSARVIDFAAKLRKYIEGLPPELKLEIRLDGHTDDRPTVYLGLRPDGTVESASASSAGNNEYLSRDRARFTADLIDRELRAFAGRYTKAVAWHSYRQPDVPYEGVTDSEALANARKMNRRVVIAVATVRR